ncbi:hypothetical protein NHQ30_010329 [Ciborinia camelliae]|nr:hypothetical protein NHQ30_010329 [Ciborinia camelliae]
MYFFKASLTSAAAFFAYTRAAYLSNDLSFGHDGKISPNGRAIPNFHLIGQPNYPDILSNRIVLTPPAPGNQRGAVWTEKKLQHSQWAADIEFRATGPERAGGSLNIWYAKDEDIKISSIYTIGKFEGLALIVDQYAGSAGVIRGFLNDGTTDYSTHESPNSLAFGHCPYSYRNRGIPSKINIRQTTDNFKVEVDGTLCFQSDKIKLPLGYVFGITAVSAENPDSFEIFKFVVTTDSHIPDNQVQDAANQNQQTPPAANNPPQQQTQEQNQGQQQQQNLDVPGEAPASNYKSSDAQFEDLHNRLQAMMKHIAALNRDFSQYQASARTRIETVNVNINTLTSTISRLESSLSKLDSVPSLEKNLRALANDVRTTSRELHEALDGHVLTLKQRVAETHGSVFTVGEGLRAHKSAVGYAGLVLIVVGSQVGLIVAYILYKKRKNGGFKKYL